MLILQWNMILQGGKYKNKPYMRYKNGSKSQFISPLISTGVLEVLRQTELRPFKKNVRFSYNGLDRGLGRQRQNELRRLEKT